MKIKFIEQEHSLLKDHCGLRIWEQPKQMQQYVIGADVAEGVGGDASCAQVIKVDNGTVVAQYWSNIADIDNYAAVLWKLGKYYNTASLCIEANNHGNGVIAHLGGSLGGLAYPNLYRRVQYDHFTQKRSKVIGFKTSVQTKPRLIENLKSALRDGELSTYDKYTLLELGNYIMDERGRMAAKGSGRDDRVMSLALAWEQFLHTRESSQYGILKETPEVQYDPNTGFPV